MGLIKRIQVATGRHKRPGPLESLARVPGVESAALYDRRRRRTGALGPGGQALDQVAKALYLAFEELDGRSTMLGEDANNIFILTPTGCLSATRAGDHLIVVSGTLQVNAAMLRVALNVVRTMLANRQLSRNHNAPKSVVSAVVLSQVEGLLRTRIGRSASDVMSNALTSAGATRRQIPIASYDGFIERLGETITDVERRRSFVADARKLLPS